MKYRAVFIGWQRDKNGDLLFPLFNIVDPQSEYYRSTVGLDRLHKEGMGMDEILWSKENAEKIEIS
jgi:hypothetical protein